MKEKFKHDMQGAESENYPADGGTGDNVNSGTFTSEDEQEKLKGELQEMKDKYLRLVAEFENFRKRTARENLEIRQTAGREVIVSLLDVLDDGDRAEKQLQSENDIATVKEGVMLVFNKLRNILQSRGLKPMQSIGTPFNPDLHEAVAEIPASSEDQKGKVIDEVQKGYYLNDKIIRFAKVIVAK